MHNSISVACMAKCLFDERNLRVTNFISKYATQDYIFQTEKKNIVENVKTNYFFLFPIYIIGQIGVFLCKSVTI